jgi:hypothetical protein
MNENSIFSKKMTPNKAYIYDNQVSPITIDPPELEIEPGP